MVAPATEGALVVVVTEAIDGERIAVGDECCDSGIPLIENKQQQKRNAGVPPLRLRLRSG